MKKPKYNKGGVEDFFKPSKHDVTLMTKSVIALDWESARFLYITIHQAIEALEETTDMYIDHIPIEEYTQEDRVQKHINDILCDELKSVLEQMESVFPALKEVMEDDDRGENSENAEV